MNTTDTAHYETETFAEFQDLFSELFSKAPAVMEIIKNFISENLILVTCTIITLILLIIVTSMLSSRKKRTKMKVIAKNLENEYQKHYGNAPRPGTDNKIGAELHDAVAKWK